MSKSRRLEFGCRFGGERVGPSTRREEVFKRLIYVARFVGSIFFFGRTMGGWVGGGAAT